MHFCFVNMPIEYYSPVSGGAISTIIMSTARELLARDHRVSVLTIVNDDGHETYAIGDVIPIRAPKRDDLHFLQRRLSSLRRRLSRWDWPYFEHYLRSVRQQLALLSPAPDAVVVFNDLVSPSYLKRTLPAASILVWLQNEWNTRFDVSKTDRATRSFLTCSDSIRHWTSRRHHLPLDRFRVVHSGVDRHVFRPRPDYLDPVETPRVLFLGRIDPNKGPDIAADAVAALRAEGLRLSLTVAGGLWFYGHGREMEDPFFRSLKEKMDAAGAQYLGHVPRPGLPELVRQHDIACVLSRSQEPFGLVALEAMASGCAVISSDRGGLPEACGNAATLLDPDDFQAVKNALRRLVTDPALLRRAKQQSVERAAQAPWSACAQHLEEAASPAGQPAHSTQSDVSHPRTGPVLTSALAAAPPQNSLQRSQVFQNPRSGKSLIENRKSKIENSPQSAP
jgi:glycosyltransferase involved in cell wall biosynthesis